MVRGVAVQNLVDHWASNLRDTFRSLELGEAAEMEKEGSEESIVKDIRLRTRQKYSVMLTCDIKLSEKS